MSKKEFSCVFSLHWKKSFQYMVGKKFKKAKNRFRAKKDNLLRFFFGGKIGYEI
jgi:hypothetical protein